MTAPNAATPPQPNTSRLEWLGLLLVLLIYLALAISYSQVTPFNKGPDEGYHLDYVTFIKEQGRLPITYAERASITRADFPPLYHLLVVGASSGVDLDSGPTFKIFWDSFRYRAMDHYTPDLWTLDTEDFQPPYLGRMLVWQMGRWLSVALGVGTLLIVFLTLRETPLGRWSFAPLAGTAMLAFLPQFTFLSAALNDDNLLGLVAALYFFALLKAIQQPRAWWPFVAMGLLLGLSMTVKYSLVVVPLEVLLLAFALMRKFSLDWGWFWQRVLTVGLLAMLASSWWFGWNLWHLNTIAEDGPIAGTLRPLLAGGSDTTLNRLSGVATGGEVGLTALPEETNIGTWSEFVGEIVFSFWSVRIGGEIPLAPWVWIAVVGIVGLAAFGWWRLWQRDEQASRWLTDRQWLLLLAAHTLIFLILPLLRFGLTRRLSVAAQGRHVLMPAAAALMVLLVWGVIAALPKKWHLPTLGAMVAGLLLWNGAHLSRMATFTPPPLPVRTVAQAADWLPQPIDARFGDNITLSSYALTPRPDAGLLDVELAWQTAAPLNESYQFRLALRDSAGEIVSHWQGYHGGGRVPTLAWEPDMVIFDRLALPLPDLAAGEYTLEVAVLSRAGPIGDAVTLSPVTLPETRLPLADHGAVDAILAGSVDPFAEAAVPTYRYPAAISVITAPSAVEAVLLGPAGQRWQPTASAAGVHNFVIGPRWESGLYQLELTHAGETVTLPDALRVENWWQREFTVPEIAMPINANFANQFQLLGYQLPEGQVQAGDAFPVTLYWQALPEAAPQADFTQFNNLLDSSGTLRGGYDRRPLEYYSTLLWAPGEIVVDGYAVPVEADAPPGEYYLDVGFYITVGESAVNLPLVIDGQMSETTSVTIGPIEVVAP